MSKRSADNERKFGLKILISLFLFVCLLIFSSAVMLKKGISFDSFTIGRTTLSDFSLQWQERLRLQIGTVTVSKQQQQERSPVDLSLIGKGINGVQRWGRLFSEISINVIKVGELTGTIHFDRNADQNPCFFTLTSKDLTFRSNLAIEQNTLVITLTEAISKQFNSRGFGQIRLNGEKEQLTGSLTANLGGSLPLTLDFSADQEKISFQGGEAGRIKTITPFVDLFGLDHNIQRWITDYLTGSRYNLRTFRGVLPWNEPQAILDTFYAEVRVDDCEYTFAPGLEAIKTAYTDVVFSKGVLAITPHESTFYGQAGEESWLDINFRDAANIILTAYIRTHARANNDILNLLAYYNIRLPFKQTGGKTATDLTLTINLNETQVSASGIFLIEEGILEHEEKNYGVTDAEITLVDSNIAIEHGLVRLDELFAADISGTFNAGNGVGDLDITVQQFSAKTEETTLTLNGSEARPTIQYSIRPDGHSLKASASSWKLDNLQLNIASFSTPFSFKELSGTLPPTLLSVPHTLSAKISGPFSIKEKKVDFHCDINKYHAKDLHLESPNVPISINYDQKLTIRSEQPSHWSLNNIPTTLYHSELNYGDNVLSLTDGRISYGSFFDSRISGQYNYFVRQGAFLLEQLHIREKNIGHLLGSSSGIDVEISRKNESLVINVPELDLEISTGKNKSWSARFNDLAAIHRHSTVLQQYLLDAGSLTISSKNGEQPYNFAADIPFPYSFLMKDGKVVEQLQVTGDITSHGVRATVNEELQIQYNDQLTITSRDLAYNIPAIFNFLKDRPKSIPAAPLKEKKLICIFEASNSSLFFKPGSQILADRIYFECINNKTSIHLQHGPGTISLDIEGDSFSLMGQEFNDTFMDAFFQGARFQNGQMSMAAKGSFDNFTALFKIENTILKDFRILHNTLAVLNTIPALVTFSLPEYSSEGLPVSSAVAGMEIKEGIATLESVTLESSELHLTGSGRINFPENLIDMDFNLITQAKENMTKIPLIGYILVGEEKHPSVTIKVSGDLLDPKVENSVFQEVATIPFSILYRTLKLPVHLVDSMNDSPEYEDSEASNPYAGEIDEKKPASAEAVYRE